MPTNTFQIPIYPACDSWGMSRGMPVDRYYIDAFLSRHAADIRGHVLEIGDDGYSRRFGGKRIDKIDVLDVNAENSRATIAADLTNAPDIPNDTFDCIIITQVLTYIKDLQRAVDTLVRITKPGGFILCTQPSITRIASFPGERENWCWSLYPTSARWLFSRGGIERRTLVVESWGNLRTATAFLWGLAQEDLTEEDFMLDDFRYPLVTTVRAVKAQEG